MIDKITIFWFRQDLRISDNPGLVAAAENGLVMPIYIFEDKDSHIHSLGGASKWWLYHSLNKLNKSLCKKLNLYIGNPQEIILKIIKQHNISSVYWNRCYEPYRIQMDSAIKQELTAINIECKSFNGSLLWEPWDILKKDSTYYKVFTYFYRNGCLQAKAPRVPLPIPKKLNVLRDNFNKCTIEHFKLLSVIKWYKNVEAVWQVGENVAQEKLVNFLNNYLSGYKEGRNYPDQPHISKLSPHLHFGEISPNQVWYAAKNHDKFNKDLDHFLSEIGWREFSYYLLYHFPGLPKQNFQSKFIKFPWRNNVKLLKAWQRGQTGYPFVDAGMRELWQTGYIHNRVRMVVGSFLVKNLLLHWRYGAEWFWDCLVDADLANNSASWQWVAGSGADAAPYFRIFNPVTQGEKFDEHGNYTRKFIPELKKLPNKYLFKPWEAPEEILKNAGILLGTTYPKPIVSMVGSRIKALDAYKTISLDII